MADPPDSRGSTDVWGKFEEHALGLPAALLRVVPTYVATFRMTTCIRGNTADFKMVPDNFDPMCKGRKRRKLLGPPDVVVST